jgi:predicted enzyme related to lactoylglutathione lyase
MTDRLSAVIYPVKDLEKAKTLYSELPGVQPVMDEAYYVGFEVDGLDVGLDPHGHSQGLTGPVGYWLVDDITKSVQSLLDAGGQAHQDVKDVGGGKLVATVKDADGNVIGLTQPA